jgi:hypothetical protein
MLKDVKTNRGLCRKEKYMCYKKLDNARLSDFVNKITHVLNDFYWINLVESKYFFIIPEQKMQV